ncbi:MAG TPA: hypothetical protein VH500_22825 [Nitrososphaeraceae archaeon]|jgi:hypothetical protein
MQKIILKLLVDILINGINKIVDILMNIKNDIIEIVTQSTTEYLVLGELEKI